MPWLKSFGRVSGSNSIAWGGLEKLEDRVAVAATATLAAGGIIFDGAPQLFATNEPKPLSRAAGSGGLPSGGDAPHHKTGGNKQKKKAGGARGGRRAAR